MAERLLKCYDPECVEAGLKYPKSQLHQVAGKNYCPKHYPKRRKDSIDLKALNNYVSQLFKIPYPTPKMREQIYRFHNVNHFEYLDMIDTLEVIKSAANVSLDPAKGLGLIPYFYDQMIASRRRQESAKTQAIGKSQKTKIAYCNLNPTQSRDHWLNKKMIPMDGDIPEI